MKRKAFLSVATVLLVLVSASGSLASLRRTPVVEAVEKAGPAVVNIRTEQIVQRRGSPFFGFGGSFFEDFFREFAPPRLYTTESLGSGVLIDPGGLILTNAHVISRASKIFVALAGRHREIEAKLVGRDDNLDLALIRIPAPKGRSYPFLRLGRSDDLMIGEPVIAIGNPLGLGSSITTGVVSGPLRALTLDKEFMAVFIQTDALINPGNSGGPLINLEGKVIGINTAIARQAQGIGFAIPADVIRRVLPDLKKYGHLRRSFFGVVPGATGEQFAAARGYGGVLVTEVIPGSPADRAGLELADVILEIDDIPVETPGEFLNILGAYIPGNRVSVRFLRGIESRTADLRLEEFPPGFALRYAADTFGFSLEEWRGKLRVADLARGGPAERVGMRRGDLVIQAAGQEVSSLKDYARVIEETFGRLPLQFLVVRGNQGYYIDLP
ncbi:serine protease Do [Geothermobacter ehrlichii]|uniref:Serine protease Do n=1 Tax=Geothermobacter ehrlichii TaxID=213224 RepID=A0A5D3WN44_9BACT|nr:serine protease Do [Geothermobacter ehrlichii]